MQKNKLRFATPSKILEASANLFNNPAVITILQNQIDAESNTICPEAMKAEP
jgi:hypothetical protein